MRNAVDDVVNLDRLVWVVVGDLAKIEPGIRELGFGEIRFIDPDGQEINNRVAEAR